MSRAPSLLALILAGLALLGCRGGPRAPIPDPESVATPPRVGRVPDLLGEADASGEGARTVPFAEGLATSEALEIRGEHAPHYHVRHDATIVVLEGQGSFAHKEGGTWHVEEVGPRTVVHVPKGTVHAFRQEGSYPVRAFRVLAPRRTAPDRVMVDQRPPWPGTEQ